MPLSPLDLNLMITFNPPNLINILLILSHFLVVVHGSLSLLLPFFSYVILLIYFSCLLFNCYIFFIQLIPLFQLLLPYFICCLIATFFSSNVQLYYLSFGSYRVKIQLKGTTVTKVRVLTKDYILHVSYMYWSIKYQNYILNVIYGTRY